MALVVGRIAFGAHASQPSFPAQASPKSHGAFAWRWTLCLRGLAVTIPHKEALLGHLDEADEAVQSIGAANTVVWRSARP